MTLLYWWMHWFWITGRLYLALSEPTLPHSTSEPSTTDLAHGATKAFTPPNASLITASLSKMPMFPNMTRLNTTKPNNKEATVINQPESGFNLTDQALINSTFAFNHTDLAYFNETNYNQSAGFSSEKIIEMEEELVGNLSAAGITGITLGCVVVVGIICGVSYFLYRNRGFNRPQVLNDRCSNPDSSGYIDDASVRDNSEEMYSLDNDSFLNSLEAMTIQNYWTDTVKHTKL